MTAPSRDEESSAACKRENSCDDSARKLADSPRRASVLFILYLALSFIGGLLAGFALCFALRSAYRPCGSPGPAQARLAARPPPTIPGSKTSHIHPPPSPTNALPFLFPTNVGYAGATPTGAEPGLLATAPSYPIHTGAPQLVTEPVLGESDDDFDIFRHWGNLSPWFSVGSFGLDTTPDAPDGCTVTGLHFLHRHGARYPTMDGKRPVPVQTFNNSLPVFRTESEDRMLHSALNFAAGFFGIPYEDQYLQSITIEASGFNNTLAPYSTCVSTPADIGLHLDSLRLRCNNANDPAKGSRGDAYTTQWTNIYLADALDRLKSQIEGIPLSTADVYAFQQLCAYETVAIGYSKFCSLFTEDEWRGFQYALDLGFWYNSAFGSPVARAQGVGYVQELIARLTQTPITIHNTTTNSTLNDNPAMFPLKNALYVDATHEVVVLNIITALNLSNFAASGPLPADHILPNRSFNSAQLAPFGTNMQFQVLSCLSKPRPQIRIIINDAVTPLTGISGCPEDPDGMCPVQTFVAAQSKIIQETDWAYDCLGNWTVPAGAAWSTTTGDAPRY
ncbi:hypothetical protein BOTBODRAFT_176358 [Botryobasidium botryosum FD-172 SS1]|uniref:Phytase n=1 Tax=Botryobasidium botryosum (strain FD-172 SS1) TaxID=930990 RepID=A0A067MA37_BOTB1|nr:hypothetical protein BOTBODRAFT_176358 [Botryobasidium botryosum FD-172 SS1]